VGREQKKWTGIDTPDFDEEKPPDYVPPDDAKARTRSAATTRSSCRPTAGLAVRPAGLEDGPLPTHYEPHESPFEQPSTRSARTRAASRTTCRGPVQPARRAGADVYPYVVTTYRLTEHHTAGGCHAFVPYLSELQPAMFVEVHPDLARERGLEHGDWATIVTARSAIEARVLVTDRMRRSSQRARQHQVGLPYHWGSRGLTTGGSANDLAHMALDPNVHIQEVKAFTCDIRPAPARAAAPAGVRRERAARALARARPASDAGHLRRRASRAWASSPTRRSASAARRARSRARSGTSCPRTASSGPARATTTRRRSARTRGGTSRSSSSASRWLDGETATLDDDRCAG
jgi:formate dehydrogenase major subunit